jgi:hypothetical protein
LLDLRDFITEFPRPLGELQTTPEVLGLLSLAGQAPLHSNDDVRAAVRGLLRHGGFKPTGRSKPASEYLIRAANEETLSSRSRRRRTTRFGRPLPIHVDGQLAGSTTYGMLAISKSDTVWFGTTPDAAGLWDRCINELAMFDRALSSEEIAAPYQAAQEEMAR